MLAHALRLDDDDGHAILVAARTELHRRLSRAVASGDGDETLRLRRRLDAVIRAMREREAQIVSAPGASGG